ncbi:hypothetical protein Amsp01_024920 [Amycolatopsis sp. NBRC 101858]|uniref:hypothetical protein n=1 Tax=Amycolatopsis sp. NBRC 101858 TaxID=3032200 RepID=UPI0024A35FB2|nr:hypothetical protein [Amycolatopsis sp. NBRC 101858]GLY36468.1 hypothetical protein Amsp01_024920 [Amycolatopsis sp. NBRC 101858]
MGRTLNRVAGVVSAAALATFVAAPVALAEDETPTSTTETTTSTSETTTSSSPTSTSSEAPSSAPSSPSGTASSKANQPEVKTTDKRIAPKAAPEVEGDTQEAPPADDDYQDNTGAGAVGVGGEGSLTINCAAGAPGNVATQYLDVTGGPDQDGADGRIWHYSVRVTQLPPGTTTGKFSWTCVGVDGEGVVTFEQAPPPETSTTNPSTTTSAPTTTSSSAPSSTSASSTAPVTTATSTSAASGNSAPKAQVKVTPKGGIETGFGGTAR